MEKIRLQKFFTDNKIMSRRNAEKVIEAGNVKVNGVIAKLGDKVDPEKDTVTYNKVVFIHICFPALNSQQNFSCNYRYPAKCKKHRII